MCVCMCVYICECMCVCMREREKEKIILVYAIFNMQPHPPFFTCPLPFLDIPTDNGVVCDLESRAEMQHLWRVKWRGMAVIDGNARRSDGKRTLANLLVRVDPRRPSPPFYYIANPRHMTCRWCPYNLQRWWFLL